MQGPPQRPVEVPSPYAQTDVHAAIMDPYVRVAVGMDVPYDKQSSTSEPQTERPPGYPYTHMDVHATVPTLPSNDFIVDLNTNIPRITDVDPKTYTPTHTSTTRKY